MSKTVYVKGMRVFAPHEKAPDFVKGALIITPKELVQFIKDNPEYLSEYNGEKQLKCQILEGDKGLYFTVDTWKPDGNSQPQASDDVGDGDSLPF